MGAVVSEATLAARSGSGGAHTSEGAVTEVREVFTFAWLLDMIGEDPLARGVADEQ